MEVAFALRRWGHHAGPSGYPQVAARVARRAPVRELTPAAPPLPARAAAALRRAPAIVGETWPDLLHEEWAAARWLASGSRRVCHLLDGEWQLRHLANIPRRGALLATLHQPPAFYDEVPGARDRARRLLGGLDAAVALCRAQAAAEQRARAAAARGSRAGRRRHGVRSHPAPRAAVTVRRACWRRGRTAATSGRRARRPRAVRRGRRAGADRRGRRPAPDRRRAARGLPRRRRPAAPHPRRDLQQRAARRASPAARRRSSRRATAPRSTPARVPRSRWRPATGPRPRGRRWRWRPTRPGGRPRASVRSSSTGTAAPVRWSSSGRGSRACVGSGGGAPRPRAAAAAARRSSRRRR